MSYSSGIYVQLWFYFARKFSLKKAVYTITFNLQFLCIAGYLKRNNNAPKLNIHKLQIIIKK